MDPTGKISVEPRENSEIEFKAGFNYDPMTGTNKLLRHGVAKAVCGFLNASGGRVYIGIMDDGQVCGIEEELAAKFGRLNFDLFEQGIHEFLKNTVSPYPFMNIRITFAAAEAKTVAVIEVKPVQHYVYLVNKGQNAETHEIYVRTGNRTILLSDKARDQFVAERLGAKWLH